MKKKIYPKQIREALLYLNDMKFLCLGFSTIDKPHSHIRRAHQKLCQWLLGRIPLSNEAFINYGETLEIDNLKLIQLRQLRNK